MSSTTQKMTTELYVWGDDSMGQLGLGHRYLSKDTDKKYLLSPKTCTFNILI